MNIKEGQPYRVVEGSESILGMQDVVMERGDANGAIRLTLIGVDGALLPVLFEPQGEVQDVGDVLVIDGVERGSTVPSALLMFRDPVLNERFGALIVA